MASLKRKQTLFSGVARKAKEIRQNSTNLAFDNKTNARKGSKIATADARLAIYVFYLSMIWSLPQGSSTALPCRCFVAVCGRLAEQTNKKKTMYVHTKFEANLNLI